MDNQQSQAEHGDKSQSTESLASAIEPLTEEESRLAEQEDRAFKAYECLAFFKSYSWPEKPPAIKNGQRLMYYFLADHRGLNIVRATGESDLIATYDGNGRKSLSPEGGWNSLEERESCFEPLESEAAYIKMTKEELLASGARSSQEDDADADFLKALRCPPLPEPTVQLGQPLEPRDERAGRCMPRTMFVVKGHELFACRYSGDLVDAYEDLPEPKREWAVLRWREYMPAPAWGWESHEEKRHFLEWIQWKKYDLECDSNRVPVKDRPSQPLECARKIEPFAYPASAIEAAGELVASFHALKKSVAKPFGVLADQPDGKLRAYWSIEDGGAVVPPGFLENNGSDWDLMCLQHQVRSLQEQMSGVQHENTFLERRVRELEMARESWELRPAPSASVSLEAPENEIAPAGRPASPILGPALLPIYVANPPDTRKPRWSGGSVNMEKMIRYAEQRNCPDSLWDYRLGGMQKKRTPPTMWRDPNGVKGVNYYAIDLPRKYYKKPIAEQPMSDPEWENSEANLELLLIACYYDPDYRGLDMRLIRIHFYKHYSKVGFPASAMVAHACADGLRRYRDRLQGRNDGNDCHLCFGSHYLKWCFLFPLNSMKRRLLTLRRLCLQCKGRCETREGEECQVGRGYQCGKTACLEEGLRHHKDVCSRDELDLERQRYIMDDEEGFFPQ